MCKLFNADLAYDRFLLLQLAADQVAPKDQSTLAAMGLLTLGRRFLGVTQDIIDDRIDVVSRGLLGLTVGCARCHDHKYDPIPTADYYSMYGVFQNCADQLVPVPRRAGIRPPGEKFEKALQARKKELLDVTAARRAEAAERIRQRIDRYLLAQGELEKYPDPAFGQVLGKGDLIPTIVRRWESFLLRAKEANAPVFAPWFAFAEIEDTDFATKASDITKRLLQSADKTNPRVAAAFEQPPASRAEVAQRYKQILLAVDK